MDELVCIDCGQAHPVERSRCGCGGALDPPDAGDAIGADELQAWASREDVFGAVAPARRRISLGEGWTPLVGVDELGASFKVEGANPTGSFKDRGASVLVGAAQALGARRVTEDSSGNAGAAVAAYAAHAGLSCTVFSPEHVTDAKRERMRTLGADVEVVEGPRREVTEAAAEAGQAEDAYYASHTYPPWFVQGCSTIALEIVRQHETTPDTVVAPAAMGSVVLGLQRGLTRLKAGGAIDAMPRLVAVQAAGIDPVAQRFDGDVDGDNRFADGLLVPEPPRDEQIVEAIRSSGGTALSVPEEATREAMADLHAHGLLAEASAATTLAGIRRLRAEGRLDEEESTVAVLTGAWTP
jgi:threonine synthase